MMFAFVWERLSEVTDNWHDEGGLLIIAPSLARARELHSAVRSNLPDVVYPLASDPEEHVYVFPDAGCC